MKARPIDSVHFLCVAAALALTGCLEPLADPADGGPEVSAAFEVSGADLGQWVPDTLQDTGADASDDALADAEDVSATDAVDASDDVTADALPDDATASDIADDGTATSLPDATTGADASLTCGDGKCVKADKENCKTCPADCGDCPSVCGDGTCASDESCSDCPSDCGGCTLVCAILGSSGCLDTQQCYPDGKANLCSAAGSKSVGDACVYFNECQKGQLCVSGTCHAVCDFTAKDANWQCQPGVTCSKVNVGGTAALNLGACTP